MNISFFLIQLAMKNETWMNHEISQRFWSYVKTMNTENTGIPTLMDGNEIHISNKCKANALNSHFQKQFTMEPSFLLSKP